jgi:hypothetical protein
MNVGRNDPCPCMSGKKFEHCCAKTNLLETFYRLGYEYYNERYTLSDILEENSTFKRFYEGERKKISKPTVFIKGRNIGSAMSFGNIEGEFYLILSENSIIPKADTIHVAHEIMHLVLCSEGYKVVNNKQDTKSNSYNHYINDMIHEPVFNKRLLSYGFDIKGYLNLSDERQMKSITNNSRNPHDLFLLKTLYVKRTLDYRNLNSNIEPNEIPFNIWISKHYSNLIPECESLLNLVDENGFDTPMKCEIVLNKIVEKFNMQTKLKVEYM